MEDWNVNITRALLEECEAGLSPSANGMSAKKAKKKARAAGAGTHQQGQVISFQFSSGYRWTFWIDIGLTLSFDNTVVKYSESSV